MMFMFKINGVTMKTPSSLNWAFSDLSSEESARTLDGKSHKDIIAQKVKLSPAWMNPSGAETSILLKAVCPHAYVNITYIDPIENAVTTKRFYTGDKGADVNTYAFGDVRYSTMSFNCIEE